MSFFRRFPKNTQGRDFIVGDIHGCFGVLRRALTAADFNHTRDRLFSVGDLVDRGPSSHEAVDWLDYPWFHAVMGNHEYMALQAAVGDCNEALHRINGGDWWYALNEAERHRTALAFTELPVAIEIETATGAVGIVHAEPVGLDWPEFTDMLVKPLASTLNFALWCRDRYTDKNVQHVAGIDRIYVGHTPVKSPLVLGNVFYIDTGAVFGRSMTLVCLDNSVTQVAA